MTGRYLEAPNPPDADRRGPQLLPPPANQLDLGDRILIFWSIYSRDKASSIITGFASAIDDVHEDIITPLPRPPLEYETNDVRAVDVERLSDLFKPSEGRGMEWRPDTIFASQLKGIMLVERARAASASPKTDQWERINSAIQRFLKEITQMHPSINSTSPTRESLGLGLVTAVALGYTAAIFLNADLSATEADVQQDRVRWAKLMANMMVELPLEESIRGCAMFGYAIGKAAEVLIIHKKVMVAKGLSSTDTEVAEVEECVSRILGALERLATKFPALILWYSVREMNVRSSPPPANEPIQAYYKLSFPNFEYYLQTLSVTIGRRPRLLKHDGDDEANPPPATSVKTEIIPESAGPSVINRHSQERSTAKEEVAGPLLQLAEAAEEPCHEDLAQNTSTSRPHSPQPSTSSGHRSKRSQSHSSSGFPRIDVDLGPLKNVSRLHARIDYDDTIDKFVLYVNGRNGAWVDGQWVGTKIQIAARTFYFVLPPPSVPESPLTPETTPEADTVPTAAEDCPAEDDISPRSNKHAASRSPSPVPAKKRRLKPPRSPVKSPIRAFPDALPRVRRPARAGSGSSSSSDVSSPQRTPQADSAVLPQQTDPNEESECDDLVSIGDLEQDELNELRVLDDSGDGGRGGSGKGSQKAGKGVRRSGGMSSKGLSAKSRADLKSPSQASSEHSPTASSHPQQLPTIRPLPVKIAKELLKQSMPAPDPNAPKQPKRYMTQRLIQKTQLAQLPRPPPEKMPPKPPFTYAILCFRAIQELGGKASLSEIVNWIRDTHEWYRWNDECGWEASILLRDHRSSSVRHNLSSNPGFVKGRRDADVERIQAATGQPKKTKGFFWSVDPKAADSFLEKEREIIEAGSRAKAQQKAKAAQQAGLVDPAASVGSSTGVNLAGLPPSALPAVPVPMMAPRGAGPPPPVGMSMTALHPHPHILPPPTMVPPPTSAPMPTMHSSLPPQPPPSVPHIPGTPTPTGSAPFPHALPDVCLSITVGPPPAGADTDTFSSPYVDGPPITLRNGALFLNPTIFSGLSQEQLDDLQKLKAQAALEILMTYTKNYVKEQIVRKGKAKAKAKSSPSVPGNGTNAKPNEPSKSGEAQNQLVSASPAPPSTSSVQSTVQFDAASVLAVANLASASAGSSISPPPLNPSTVVQSGSPALASNSASPPLPPAGQPVPVYPGFGQTPQTSQPPHPYTYYPYPSSGSWTYPKAPPTANGSYHYPAMSPQPPGLPNQSFPAYPQPFPHYPPSMPLPQHSVHPGYAPPSNGTS
ncbi:Pre-rRNA-processing protein fhl1 [Tulasnella sp. 424]|nr:Pre-rRNA-processing protein fhl1 [Tulasnella sp. 424]